MKSLMFLHLFVLSSMGLVAQQGSIPDTVNRLRYPNPNPEFSMGDSVDCARVMVFLFRDSTVNDIAVLRTHFTDQFLQVCYTQRMYPASRIWGYNAGNKYYRSGSVPGNRFVFAERMLSGKYSLYYCRSIPGWPGDVRLLSGDPKNPDYMNRNVIEDRSRKNRITQYHYFITPPSDSSQMILVNSRNIKTVAKDHFKDCPPAYQDAMKFHRRYRTVQNITLGLGVASYIVSFLNPGGQKVDAFNYDSPFLYVSLASLGTFVYYRIKANRKSLQPDEMKGIIHTLNQY